MTACRAAAASFSRCARSSPVVPIDVGEPGLRRELGVGDASPPAR